MKSTNGVEGKKQVGSNEEGSRVDPRLNDFQANIEEMSQKMNN
jgi:hypothetical protein